MFVVGFPFSRKLEASFEVGELGFILTQLHSMYRFPIFNTLVTDYKSALITHSDQGVC